VKRSAFRNVLRIRQVKLVGKLAYLAANAAGLVIVDLADPAAPVQKGQLMTTKPCYNVNLSGNEAILALGGNDLLSVTVSNPAAPTRNGSDTPYARDPDLSALQTALGEAINRQKFRKDDSVLVHALRAWLASPSGGPLNWIQGIIVVVNGPPAVNGPSLRGESWLSDGFNFAGDDIKFPHTMGVIYFAHDAESNRIAHEIIHWFGVEDIYTNWFADGTYLEGTAGRWCLSGMESTLALFCGHRINDKMHFYSTAKENNNVAKLEWSPTEPKEYTFDIHAHDSAEDRDPNPEHIHILKLEVAKGLYYYVEVRQKPIGRVFDQHIIHHPDDMPDGIPPGEPGVVLVTRVTESTTISNTFERPVMLFGVLTQGQQVMDAGRNLVIRAENRVRDRPLIYHVRVQWNQPISPTPDGKFDMTITPWNTDTWDTVDIWVDSPRNNPLSGQEYEFYEGMDKSKPRLNGDRPWLHHKNTVYARIRNTGRQDISNVYVTFAEARVPVIGDNGSWATKKTEKIPLLPGRGETTIPFEWTPSENQHTCLKIDIMPQIGEVEPKNNMAQENVLVFDSEAGSSHKPVVIEAEVHSPFVVLRKVDIIVRGLPVGWHAMVDNSWVWLEGHGSTPLRAIIWTDRDGTNSTSNQNQYQQEIPPIAYARVEGWTNFDHRYLPIGGLLAAVKAVKKVKVDNLDVNVSDGILKVDGCIDIKLVDIPITIEVIDEKGNSWLFYSVTDDNGCFHFNSDKQHFRFYKGTYTVQVFVTAGGDAAEAESDVLKFEV
jgi:hypothetical protein